MNRFVAIGNGQVIADAETFDAMLLKLAEIGWNPRDVMVVQGGVFMPDFTTIVLYQP